MISVKLQVAMLIAVGFYFLIAETSAKKNAKFEVYATLAGFWSDYADFGSIPADIELVCFSGRNL